MKVLAVVLALAVAANAGVIAPAAVFPATTLVRTPSLDSAIIKSDRLGGNFAYSSVEGHAYAAVSPVVQNVVSPIGVSYSATPVATPINLIHQQVQYVATPQVLAPQLIASGAVFGSPQIISPVAPGIIAPTFPITASENLIPVAPEAPKEGEPAAVVEEAAPVEAAPAPVEAAPQADDIVEVESA